MKNLRTFTEFINESYSNELYESKKGMFVVKSGTAYQSLWNNSTPSVTYNDTSEIFTNQGDALKYATNKLKNKKHETSMGQGGIPGGYSYTVVNLFEVLPDSTPENWTSPFTAKADGAIEISITSSGKLEADAVKRTEEIRTLATLENIEQIEPDSKDTARADALFNSGWTNDDKAITQCVSIGDPKKLVRRIKAMVYAQINAALREKKFYTGNELEKGLDKWHDGFPWAFSGMRTYDFVRKYNKRWDTMLSNDDINLLMENVHISVINRIKKENPNL